MASRDTTVRDQQAELKRQEAVRQAVDRSNVAGADVAAQRDPSADRAAELDRQAAVVRAVSDATRDADGNPIPIRPDGITIVEGQP